MEETLESAIQETKAVLQPIFSKPKCSTKLLTKPPFRFLHDIVTATLKATGFPDGLFAHEELDSKNVKEKADKIAFLDKIIYLVSVCVGSAINARSSKIVAGLEPLNTNVLLTEFGRIAVDRSFDHAGAIAYCIQGGPIEGFIKSLEQKKLKDSTKKPATRRKSRKKSTHEKSRDISEEKVTGGEVEKTKEANAIEDARANATEIVNESKHEGRLNESPSEDALRRDTPIKEVHHDAAKEVNSDEVNAAKEKNRHKQSSTNVDIEEQVRQCNSDHERTRQMIGSIISKPKCSDKLLGKPPFRFLHDVIMAVGKSTHYELENVFSQEEMDSSNVKDKQSKLKFLEKIIKVVELKLGIDIEAKPGKIVAGLEADKTCHFLQLFALAATTDKGNSENKGNHEPNSTKQEIFNNDVAGMDGQPPDTESSKSAEESYSKREAFPAQTSSRESEKKIAESKEQYSEATNQATKLQQPGYGLLPSSYDDSCEASNIELKVASTTSRPITVSFKEKPKISLEEKNEDPVKELHSEENATKSLRSIRPSTARRRPPRVKDQSFKVEEEAMMPVKLEKPKIFTDDDDEEADFFHNSTDNSFEHDHENESSKVKVGDLSAEGHTAIVQKIFNDQAEKGLQDPPKHERQGGGKQVNAPKNRFRLHTKKNEPAQKIASNLSSTDLEKIASSIQRLTQSTAPLGRCMDFVQEDLSQMVKEREFWKSGHQKKMEALIKSNAMTKSDEIEPLQKSLSSLEDRIEEKIRQIESIKRQISRNDNWIRNHIETVLST